MISQPSSERYLFIPANPTPNGRLHIGHMAGPYLRMDLYARFLKTLGHSVEMIFGTDAYDSYVEAMARKKGCTADELAMANFEHIKTDLQALNIGFDLLINPIAEEYASDFRYAQQQVMDQLDQAGLLMIKPELTPYSTIENRPIVGAELVGICRECGSEIGGVVCEECGIHHPIHQVQHPRDHYGRTLAVKEMDQVFLHDELKLTQASFDNDRLSETARKVIARHLHNAGDYYRLTQLGDRGVFWNDFLLANSAQLFSYNIFFGELYARRHGTANPMNSDENVIVVSGFGIDNIVPHIVFKKIMSQALPQYKTNDEYLVNYFLNLEGSKFSTSRGHVIWAGDIINHTPVQCDGLRLYLTTLDTSLNGQNFEPDAFVTFYNEQYIGKIVSCILRMIADMTACTDSLPAELENQTLKARKTIHHFFQPDTFVTQYLAALLIEFLATPVANHHLYWQLKAFSIIAFPIMPELCLRIWIYLGEEEAPNYQGMNRLTTPSASFQWKTDSLTPKELENCLPQHLKLKTQTQ